MPDRLVSTNITSLEITSSCNCHTCTSLDAIIDTKAQPSSSASLSSIHPYFHRLTSTRYANRMIYSLTAPTPSWSLLFFLSTFLSPLLFFSGVCVGVIINSSGSLTVVGLFLCLWKWPVSISCRPLSRTALCLANCASVAPVRRSILEFSAPRRVSGDTVRNRDIIP